MLAASRAGLQPVLVNGAGASLLVGTAAIELPALGPIPAPSRRRIVLCPANVLPQPRWLRALLDMPVEADTLYVDPDLVALIETADPGKILLEAARCRSAEELVATLGGRFERVPAPFDPDGRFRVSTPQDRRRAEKWLLRSLIKDSEGFMSRHFERRVSLALTRRLVATRVTPNALTLLSLTVGLGAAPFFLSSRPACQVTGALVFLAHSILDGCDGELARLKFLESRYGAMLDFWGDNVVHVAVFGCMAIGWSLSSQAAWPLVLGAAGIGSVGVATAVLSRRGPGGKTAGAHPAPLARVTDALANRDFIYLVLLLSAWGKAAWFLALVATATPIFVLLALWADRQREAA